MYKYNEKDKYIVQTSKNEKQKIHNSSLKVQMYNENGKYIVQSMRGTKIHIY